MARRTVGSDAQIKIRLKEPLRRRLEQAAGEHDVSLNREVVGRLEDSFRQDQLFGDPTTRRVAVLAASAFGNATRFRAGADEADTYRAGVAAVVAALLQEAPGSREDVVRLFEGIKGSILTRWAQKDAGEGQ